MRRCRLLAAAALQLLLLGLAGAQKTRGYANAAEAQSEAAKLKAAVSQGYSRGPASGGTAGAPQAAPRDPDVMRAPSCDVHLHPQLHALRLHRYTTTRLEAQRRALRWACRRAAVCPE